MNFQEKLIQLDCALTRKSEHDAKHTARNQNFSEEKFISDIYYLSDGGYSRLKFDEFRMKLFLVSESTPRTKNNWNRCTDLILSIERSMREWIKENGGEI